mmetsp:Transcript_112586/g.223813  ORF Transcript_112586/g.223813 Transcript_112586/m.223813 type:complete len:423 (-) Transcript_112586:10-1278(-)
MSRLSALALAGCAFLANFQRLQLWCSTASHASVPPLLGCLCGGSRHAHVRRPLCRRTASSIRNREAALSVLGLDKAGRDGTALSPEELKRAFRKGVLRWHPDAPEGDSARFQEVRDAYEFLSDTESQDVAQAASSAWEESNYVRFRARPGSRTRPSGSGVRTQKNAPEGDEETQGIRNEYVILGASLVALIITSSMLSKRPVPPSQTAYLGNRAQMTSQQQNFLLPKAQPLRGMEYMLMAQVMTAKGGGDLLLIENSQAAQLADAILASLDAAARQRAAGGQDAASPLYSMTAVVSQDQYNQVLQALRSKGGQEGFYEPNNPYWRFSGRLVARLEREATRQELLVISALDYRQPSPDSIDKLFQQKMVNEHKPDMLVFDLSESAWSSLCQEFGRATGARELGQEGAAESWPGITQRTSVKVG